MEAIDTHCHLFSPELGRRINDTTAYEVQFSEEDHEMVTALGLVLPLRPEQEQAERIGEFGSTRQIMSVRTSALIDRKALDGPLEDRVQLSTVVNDHLAELTKSYGDAFSAYADIPLSPRDVGPALKELERVHDMGGFPGVLITTNYEGVCLDDERFAPFFARAQELDVKLFLHPTLPFGVDPLLDYHMYAIVGFPADTTLAIARMVYSGFFDRYPDLTIIASHAGGNVPFLWWRLAIGYRQNWRGCREHMAEHPEHYLKRLYYDTALTDTSMLMHTYERVGDGRIVLGTDHPYEDTRRTIGAIQGMDVPTGVKEGILSGTLTSALGL